MKFKKDQLAKKLPKEKTLKIVLDKLINKSKIFYKIKLKK